MQRLLVILASLILAACAAYDGRGLQPGVANVEDVIAQMGQPALSWQTADGRQQLVFPRAPNGVHTFMAYIGPDRRLQRLENVLDAGHFAKIRPGQDHQDDILRLLGPSYPGWTAYFAERDELVWEWIFCDEWSRLARFDVLFDGKTGIVRSTYQRPDLRGPDGVAPYCSQ